jgi:methyl-accepting chemotaxis protein
MEEITSMTRQNADNASLADHLMKEVLAVITAADHTMNEMSTSMEEISTASEATSKIVKTIDEIAFQTNLLALNAAVEAARAGEAGAGFAVVADEVRNLAMRAAEAAKQTAELIETTVIKVNSGKQIVSKTHTVFQKVAESSTKVGGLIGEISGASREQDTGLNQIKQAIALVDALTQNDSVTADKNATASEELIVQAKNLRDILNDLRKLIQGSTEEKPSSFGPHHTRPAMTAKPKPILPPPRKNPAAAAPAKPKVAQVTNSTKPEDIIPMDDDGDFEDF